MRTGLEQAIAAVGSNVALARGLGVVPSAITNWKRNGGVPPKWVPYVSKLSKVPPHVLRPDLFDSPAQTEAA